MAVYGYSGKILRVDLSSGKTSTVSTADYSSRFLGGRGIAAKIYWDEVSPSVGALDPDNRLIFMTGPLCGFPGLSGSRWVICGKSPATDPESFTYCNLGGSWGAHLKFAGYDGVVVHGASDKPVYIYVEDGNVSILDASHLWGKGNIDTRRALKEAHGDTARVVSIGQAGENCVQFSIILADDDASGSGGLAASMGSKKLKAIVVKGKNKPVAANPEALKQVSQYARELTKGMPLVQKDLTPGPRMKKIACFGCIRGCIRSEAMSKDGTFHKYMCTAAQLYQEPAKRYYGPWSAEAVDVPFQATMMCDDYGIDTNSLLAMIMWLGRCYAKGVLNDETTGMQIMEMGSIEFIDKMIKMISLREGFGDVMAKGTIKAAESLGAAATEQITYYVSKAGHMTLYDPRIFLVHSLFYAMEPRMPIQQLHETSLPLYKWLDWVDGVTTSYLSSGVFRKLAKVFWGTETAADFTTYDGKAQAAVKIQDRQYARECLILCDFPLNNASSVMYSDDHIGDPSLDSRMLAAVVGGEPDEQGLYSVGERVFNLQRAILAREGHRGRAADVLDDVFYTRPIKFMGLNVECKVPGKNGEIASRKNTVVDREKFEAMKDEYYKLRGWDAATGLQTKKQLESIGLGDIVSEMEERGLVG
ncbi:MAG: aldehyde ferredoxin oxidoreductase N-terminal domain-containing protein [Dehalococcoidia bacterium]